MAGAAGASRPCWPYQAALAAVPDGGTPLTSFPSPFQPFVLFDVNGDAEGPRRGGAGAVSGKAVAGDGMLDCADYEGDFTWRELRSTMRAIRGGGSGSNR